jgi:hypothetical protein
MATRVELPPEIQEVLLALDRAADQVAEQLQALAKYVQEGKLDESVVMLKIHEIGAKLMGMGS